TQLQPKKLQFNTKPLSTTIINRTLPFTQQQYTQSFGIQSNKEPNILQNIINNIPDTNNVQQIQNAYTPTQVFIDNKKFQDIQYKRKHNRWPNGTKKI